MVVVHVAKMGKIENACRIFMRTLLGIAYIQLKDLKYIGG
jgi:hypothetical protein